MFKFPIVFAGAYFRVPLLQGNGIPQWQTFHVFEIQQMNGFQETYKNSFIFYSFVAY